MAVFSRIVILAACVVSSALFVDATTSNNAGGQVTARQLKNPQPRAHHAHVAHAHAARSSKKRSADKKRACAAKNDTVNSLSLTHTTTTTKAHTTTTTTKKATTTKTTTKAATATPKTDNSPAPTGGKAGLAWNDGNVSFKKNLLTTGKVTWCYSWSPWSTGPGCEWVPMLWSGKQVGDWKSQVAGKTFKNVLAFNEPEISGQSEMSTGEAIDLWWQYIEPMNARHGAPAVTTSPKGIAWLDSFLSGCKGCDIQFLCFHYYGMDPDDFIKTITDLHNKYKMKIWVTEWACQNYGSNQDKQCSLSTVKSFMAKTQAYLDGADYIERYAWFGALTEFPGNFNTLNRLISPSGSITDLGKQYIAW